MVQPLFVDKCEGPTERGRWERREVWRDMEKNKGKAPDPSVPTGAGLLLTMVPAWSLAHRESSHCHVCCNPQMLPMWQNTVAGVQAGDCVCAGRRVGVWRGGREEEGVRRERQSIWTFGWPLRNEWA